MTHGVTNLLGELLHHNCFFLTGLLYIFMDMSKVRAFHKNAKWNSHLAMWL